jgi:hypothetical protein
MATAEEIRAELESGPQTQDALDAAFGKYTPAQLQAAFPEFAAPGEEGLAQYAAAAEAAAGRRSGSSSEAGIDNKAPTLTPPAEDSSREKASSAEVDGNDPKALRASIQAGPQTQDALDAAMLKYTPAQLQAAFPEYGRVSDYNVAGQEAYNRQEIKDREARRANPSYVSVAVNGPVVSKVPQSEIDAAKAAAQQAVKEGKLSQEDYDFLVWRTNEINPMTQQKISQDYATQGSNPYDQKNWAMAKEANAKTARQNELYAQNGLPPQKADWTVPGYEARQAQRDKDRAAREATIAAGQSPNVVVGPGPVKPPTGSNVTPPPAPPAPPPPPSGIINGNRTPPTSTPVPSGGPVTGGPTTPITGTPPPSTGNPTTPTADVPVYGPDGTMYPSAMAARAAGVYNFTTTRPTNPAATGTNTPPPPPGTTNVVTPAPTTGLINSNNQLYTRPTTMQFPGN